MMEPAELRALTKAAIAKRDDYVSMVIKTFSQDATERANAGYAAITYRAPSSVAQQRIVDVFKLAGFGAHIYGSNVTITW